MYKDLFTSKLARKVPKVMEVLRKYMISTDAFLIDWMYTIYSKCFSIKVTRVLWDMYFLFGDYYLIRIAYSIFGCLKKELSIGKNMEDGFRYIRAKASEIKLSSIVQYTLREVKSVPKIHAILEKSRKNVQKAA
jgi:Rab-GTPase-TBC domain